MDKNKVMHLNSVIYRLYDTDNFLLLRKNLLAQLDTLIPYAYASILLADMEGKTGGFREPVCVPEDFVQLENRYIHMAHKDHTLWYLEAGQPMVICESKMVSDAKRLASPIYQECYKAYGIYDTLQATIAYDHVALGAMTLYRTMKEGRFGEEDSFCLQLIVNHLNRLFYNHLVGGGTDKVRPSDMKVLQEQYVLTKRETEILMHCLNGKDDREIVEELQISPYTLKKHMHHIYQKLKVSSRWDLLKFKP